MASVSINHFSHFYQLSLKEKVKILKKFASLNKEDLKLIRQYKKLPDFVDIENNIGPFKIATNFLINKKEYFVPMETEEPSVVAAASRGAKLFQEGGGFYGKFFSNLMIGQVQIIKVKNFSRAKKEIENNKEIILKIARKSEPKLFKLGGGAKDFFVRKIKNYLVFYLLFDPKDAQGANMINSTLEKIAPLLTKFSGGEILASIVSNYTKKRLVFVRGKIPLKKLQRGGFTDKEVARRILHLINLSRHDVFRAVTHNKGIMNGIDAVFLATGNDFRSVEAACHSFAWKKGRYCPLTRWRIKKNFLEGQITLPMPVAIVGGATQTKKALLAQKILRVKSAQELGIVCAAVGLANNFSALFAIVSEGIQKGHFRIHQEFLQKMKKREKTL